MASINPAKPTIVQPQNATRGAEDTKKPLSLFCVTMTYPLTSSSSTEPPSTDIAYLPSLALPGTVTEPSQ